MWEVGWAALRERDDGRYGGPIHRVGVGRGQVGWVGLGNAGFMKVPLLSVLPEELLLSLYFVVHIFREFRWIVVSLDDSM